MTDIAQRLRDYADGPSVIPDERLIEAADAIDNLCAAYCHSQQQFLDAHAEIERLRAALRLALADGLGGVVMSDDAKNAARAALGE